METAASQIQNVVLAANQYLSSSVDRNLEYLQRQLDVLIKKTSSGSSLKFFHPSEVLPAECITVLIQVISDPRIKQSLLLKCLLLFHNLVSDYELRHCLHGSFQITAALASIIKYNVSSGNTMIAEVLNLIQKVTYGHRISFQEPYMEDLIKFLMSQVTYPLTGLTQSALGTLVNLTRDNFAVQSYIKNNVEMTDLSRRFTKLLGDDSHHVLLFSLTLLATLCQQEKLGSKFYSDQNLVKTFQMIFNLVVDGDAGDTRRYAVDLFQDLLKMERLQKALANYEHLGSCVEHTIQLLTSSSAESVVKVFELLITFLRVDGVRQVVCKSVISTFPLQETSQFPNLTHRPLSKVADPLLAAFHWAGQSTDTHGAAPLFAFDLLTEVYEELVFSRDKLHHDKHAAAILPIVLQTLKTSLQGDNPSMQKKCAKMVKAVKLLHILCNEDNMLALVSKEIDVGLLSHIIQFQFDQNSVMMKYHITAPSSDWSHRGVDLVLYILELLCQLRGPDMKKLFVSTLQDSRVVPFLATGLSSGQRERVQATLSIVCLGSSLDDFPTIILGDTLASWNNESQQRVAPGPSARPQSELAPCVTYTCRDCSVDNKENKLPMVRSTSDAHSSRDFTALGDFSGLRESSNNQANSSTDSNSSVNSLIEKMNLGDLKDSRTSEVISVYERTLKAQQTKEQHLQDLLEAKTLALNQADRMLAQYRSKKGSEEAETGRLCSLLLESEKKGDTLIQRLSESQMKIEMLKKSIQELDTENSKLEEVAKMHRHLTEAHTELSEKHESLQKSDLALRQEHKTLTEIHEMLQKHNSNLKQQHDTAMEQLNTLTEQRQKSSKQLKDLEAKYEDMKKASLKWEYDYKRSEEERESLDTVIEHLRGEMGKVESKKKDLQGKVNNLDSVCNQQLGKIGKLEEEIQVLKTEVGKHKQIAALINSLSSGTASETSEDTLRQQPR